MTKKKQQISESDARQSRKEILLARKQAEQTRQLRIGLGIVAGLLLLVAIVAVVNEMILIPGRPVATVNGEPITLREFQERVTYERAQRIIVLERQLEAFGGDVGIIQQLAPQAITELVAQNAEVLGQSVLDLMIEERIIRQAAEERGITVTDEEVQKELEATYGYFGGASPTATPLPTATIMPTPSLTPIPTAVITDVVPTSTPLPTPTLGPTNTPRPTPTPVSEEYFVEEYGKLQAQFKEFGVDESLFREVIRNSLYREKLIEALSEELDIAKEAEHVSLWVLSYDTEEEANEGKAMVDEQGFLTVWNTVRSLPGDSGSTAAANELLWRTEFILSQQFGEEFASAAFSLPINEPSDVIAVDAGEGAMRYFIIQPSGREVRPLAEAEYQNAQRTALTNFLDEQKALGVEITESWRGRVPTTPVLDPIFFTQPTPAPTQPPLPTPAPLPTDAPDAGE